jgi:hypothetical protein
MELLLTVAAIKDCIIGIGIGMCISIGDIESGIIIGSLRRSWLTP